MDIKYLRVEVKEIFMMNKLECISIEKKIKNVDFLKEISFEVNSNECVGILGTNGSGKSTLLSIIAGTNNYDNGNVLLNKEPITTKNRSKIGYVPQQPVLIDSVTVRDNLKLWQSLYKQKNLNNIPTFLDLEKFYKKKPSELSGGMKKKVSIAIALMNDPDFLIMDEAFAALDSKTCEQMMEYLKKKKIGIIYSSHNIQEIIELCDKVLVLKEGKISYVSDKKLSIDDSSYIYSKF